eukprot:6198425-Pleurochrysis_carterae.AAC.2
MHARAEKKARTSARRAKKLTHRRNCSTGERLSTTSRWRACASAGAHEQACKRGCAHDSEQSTKNRAGESLRERTHRKVYVRVHRDRVCMCIQIACACFSSSGRASRQTDGAAVRVRQRVHATRMAAHRLRHVNEQK